MMNSKKYKREYKTKTMLTAKNETHANRSPISVECFVTFTQKKKPRNIIDEVPALGRRFTCNNLKSKKNFDPFHENKQPTNLFIAR